MFSDLAPFSKSGYKAQVNADPAIMQGVQFLNEGRTITHNLIPSLQLISQTNGSGIGSGAIIKGKILEGLTTTTTTQGPSPAPTASTSTTSASTATSASAPLTTTSLAASQNKTAVNVDSLINEYDATVESYKSLFTQLATNSSGGIAGNSDTVPIQSSDGVINITAGDARNYLMSQIKSLGNSLDTIYDRITEVTNNNSRLNDKEYDDIIIKLNNINAEIIQKYTELNRLDKLIDYVSPVAEADETSILSRQRYYVYILWFIITAIVLYITIANLINPSSSTWSLAVSLIILIGLFAFLVYNNIGSWYTRVDDDVRTMSFPNFNNLFNFDPLVTIKYTS